jgi:hypothetical protein
MQNYKYKGSLGSLFYVSEVMTKNDFFLYRLRRKDTKYDAFDTWFTTPRKAFGSMKAKYNTYTYSFREDYNPEKFEAVEYRIQEVRTINVNED